MKNIHQMRVDLRQKINEGLVMAPGAYDAWSATLIEQAGFHAVYMTGYGVSASVLGKPDIGLLTMSEMAHAAKNIVYAVDIPVIADADTGYGSNLNVMRTIYEYEMAGVAAVQLEDQVVTKRCGHMEGKQLVSIDDMVARIRAAIAARMDDAMIIIARTDACAVNGFEDAIMRAKAYITAGADVIFFEAPRSVEEMEQICKQLSVPVLVNMVEGGRTPLLSAKELERMGFRIVIYPVSALYAATQNCMKMLNTLKGNGDVKGIQNMMINFPEFNEQIKLNQIRDLEASFTHA